MATDEPLCLTAGEEWVIFSELLAHNSTIPITQVDADDGQHTWQMISCSPEPRALRRMPTPISCSQVYIEFHCCDARQPSLSLGCPGDRTAADFFTVCPSDDVRIDFLSAFFTSME